jgi:hypothetical protein
VIAAFAYLISRSTRNRFIAQAKRVKKPRYALALIFGLLYLAAFIGSQIFAGSQTSGARTSLIGGNVAAIAPLGIAIILGSVWIFGSDMAALAFTQAEVAMLFTAPVTRRALIAYKLVRMQLGVLFSAAIWVLILGRGGNGIPRVAMLVACYSLFATLGLHRLGAALVLAKREARAKEGGGRNWFVLVMTLVLTFVVMSQVIPSSAQPHGVNPFAFVDSIAAALSTPTARALLYPFRLMMAPMLAVTMSGWLRALGPALAVLALHVWWVMRTDTAFEEAAALASERRAKLIENLRARKGGMALPKAEDAGRTIKLASSGRPAAAIVWKNMLALKRQWTMSTLARPVIIALFLSFTVFRTMHDPAQIIAVVAAYLAFMLTLVGGQSLRNDLRSDMLHLPFLKAIPLSGADIVLAEVASSTLPLAAIQLVLVAIADVALGFSTGPVIIPTAIRVGMLIAAPFVLVTVNGAMLGISNGMAVLFPGWMRLGPTGAGGFEVIGQAMLSMFAMFLGFVLLLAIPTAGGGAVYWALHGSPGLATVAAGFAGSVLLAAEVYAMILGLGRAFEKAEPQQVT